MDGGEKGEGWEGKAAADATIVAKRQVARARPRAEARGFCFAGAGGDNRRVWPQNHTLAEIVRKGPSCPQERG